MQSEQTNSEVSDALPKQQQPTAQTEQPNAQDQQNSKHSSSDSDSGSDWQPRPITAWRPSWLIETEDSLKKFEDKLEEFKTEKNLLDQGLKDFQEYKKQFARQRKSIPHYDISEYFYKRKQQSKQSLLELLHPSIILTIYSYVNQDIYLELLKKQRVCKNFQSMLTEQLFYSYCFDSYLGPKYAESTLKKGKTLSEELAKISKNYRQFQKAFLYYKSMQYPKEIPQNSFRQDITNAIRFINFIHQLQLSQSRVRLQHFVNLNLFLLKHQAVIALTNLSIAGIEILRNSAVKALTNHMGFNTKLSRLFVSKSEYHKLAKEIDDVKLRVPLLTNTKLQQAFRNQKYSFGLFSNQNVSQETMDLFKCPSCDVLIICVEDIEKSKIRRKCQFKMKESNLLIEEEDGFVINVVRSKEMRCHLHIEQETQQLRGHVYNCIRDDVIDRCVAYYSAQFIVFLIFNP